MKVKRSFVRQLFKTKSYVNLDIYGGTNPQKGFITIDSRELAGVDIVHDLEKYPYPIDSNSVDLARCDNWIQHINPVNNGMTKFMDEVWRILKPGSQFMVATVYAGSYDYWADPTNLNGVTEATFAYYDPVDQMFQGELYKRFKPKPWKIVTLAFKVGGSIEVLLEKRIEDESYK